MHKNARWLVFLLLAITISDAQTIPPDLYNGLKWRLIGPFRGGRAIAAAGVLGSSTFYFGAVDGGVWRSDDAGVVWRPIFDAQHIASIGALAVAPSDPKVIYVGTGESDIRSNLSSGDGVYKSTDGGQTWTNVGLHDTRQISKIVIDPANANVVYVAALGHAYAPNPDRGVYKSTDGGATWAKVLDQGPEIGAADLAMATESPNLLFAMTWHAHRPPWSTYAAISGPGSGLFRSTDSGQSWTRLTGKSLPGGDWNRSAVAVSADGKRVYALIDAKENAGLYRSDDGGNNWTLANSDRRLTGRSWYFGNLTIDPNNPDVVYVPNVALYRSEDAGKTISIVRGAPGGDDYHQLWIDPKDSTRMVLATDQGTTISVDHGKTWTSWYNQPTAQLYHVITDDKFPYNVYGNQQDSGAIAVRSRSDYGQITARDVFSATGSEAGYIAPDPNDPNILFVTGTYGEVARFDLRTSFSQDVTPWPLPNWGTEIDGRKYRAPWAPVLLFSPFDKKTLYLGTQFVMKTVDGGLHWQTISPDLTGSTRKVGDKKPEGPTTTDNAKQRGYGVMFTIAPSNLNGDLIWAGSDTGLIHLTRDGGKTWKDVTPKSLTDWSKIAMIEASHFDPAEAYAAVDRHRLDDQAPYLYRTRDYGATWQPITDGLAAPSFLRSVREDPNQRGLVFAGTELGVYVSFDDADHWQPLQFNLPPSSVQDMVIHGDDLVIATHGRSFWILDNITPLRQATAAAKTAGDWLYRPANAVRVDNDSFLGTPLPPEEPTADNPPNGAILDYFLRAPASHVKVEILDTKQNPVCNFSSDDRIPPKRRQVSVADRWFPPPQVVEKTTGMHRFVWDLTWKEIIDPSELPSDDEFYTTRGPRAAPGAYQARLTVDGKSWTQPLTVVMDPRSHAMPDELRRQLELGRQIYAEVLRGQRSVSTVHAVQKRLTDLEPKLDMQPELKASVAQLQADIRKILADDDGGNMGLETAHSGLAAALRVVESGDRSVPSQAMELFEESDRAMKQGLEAWSTMKTGLEQLNERLRRANLPVISLVGSEHSDGDHELETESD